MSELTQVLSRYNIHTETIEKLSGGIVNETYKIKDRNNTFIVQKLADIFDINLIKDYQEIEKYLNRNNFLMPRLIFNTFDNSHTTIAHNVWIVLEYIDNDAVVVKNETLVFEAGKKLGELHKLLEKFNYKPKFSIPNFHNTEKIIEKLKTLSSKEKPTRKISYIKNELEFIVKNTPQYFLEKKRNHIQLIHGDPKFENFLFKDNICVTAIDFDTVMEADVLIDIGDALRSWSKKPDYTFDLTLFNAGLDGYMSVHHSNYVRGNALKATKLITLELSARYLIDYFEESHFVWDKEKYKNASEHNAVRCTNQIKYFKSMPE